MQADQSLELNRAMIYAYDDPIYERSSVVDRVENDRLRNRMLYEIERKYFDGREAVSAPMEEGKRPTAEEPMVKRPTVVMEKEHVISQATSRTHVATKEKKVSFAELLAKAKENKMKRNEVLYRPPPRL